MASKTLGATMRVSAKTKLNANFNANASLAILLAIITLSVHVSAQNEEEFDEYSKLNTNLGMAWSVPVNPTARFVNYGLGVVVVGAGYNINQRHALVGEFMWNSLYPTNEALNPLKVALKSNSVSAHGNLFSATMNYRYELRGHTVGTYFIGGGGLYYRTVHVKKDVVTSNNIACTPVWLWWGFTCSSGTVSTDQTLATNSSAVLGANGGIGITFKVGEPRYRMYLEARYIYAPNRPISTQLIPVTVGIRF
jgi:hypothetical protein